MGSDFNGVLIPTLRKYFNPRSPCGERLSSCEKNHRVFRFQSTLPVWGATGTASPSWAASRNFNPRSPCGERRRRLNRLQAPQRFQSTLPVWGATKGPANPCRYQEFQSTLPVWGATEEVSVKVTKFKFQSTLPVWGATAFPRHFRRIGEFQSTLPVWGATSPAFSRARDFQISIHAPRVGSDCAPRQRQGERGEISIHAPRVGSDSPPHSGRCQEKRFQSTLPVWGATPGRPARGRAGQYFNPRSPCGERPPPALRRAPSAQISIHAPRVGSDVFLRSVWCVQYHFNPRSPCGERLRSRWCIRRCNQFQSTLPVWGATPPRHCLQRGHRISIHAPRVGSDPPPQTRFHRHQAFQSTLPVWGATFFEWLGDMQLVISIHAPRVGSDHPEARQPAEPAPISIHAPRVGSDRGWYKNSCFLRYFNPRSPCGERPV